MLALSGIMMPKPSKTSKIRNQSTVYKAGVAPIYGTYHRSVYTILHTIYYTYILHILYVHNPSTLQMVHVAMGVWGNVKKETTILCAR